MDNMRRRAGRYLGVNPVIQNRERGVLSVSFDDIPASAWTEAGPVLEQHGVKATYYICGGLEGQDHDGSRQFSTDHLQALHAAGHEVGCHTFEHVSTLTLTPAELDASLARNAAWVAERLDGHVMETFAYPFGDCPLQAKPVVEARFACGRGVRDGVNAGPSDRNLLKAIGMESRRLPNYDLETLVRVAAEQRGWLIAYGHDVSDSPTPYGCTPDDLDLLLRLAKQAGLDIIPVGQAIRAAA